MKKSKDKVLDGCFAGLAEHYNVDPFFVRLFGTIILLSTGTTWIYVLCMFIMSEPD